MPEQETTETRVIKKGDPTPWGQAELVTEHAPGLYFLSTPSHGGFFADLKAWPMPPRAQAYAARWSHGCGPEWYEEDCAALLVIARYAEHIAGALEHRDQALARVDDYAPGTRAEIVAALETS